MKWFKRGSAPDLGWLTKSSKARGRNIMAAAAFLAAPAAQAESLDFAMGKALFDRPWVTAPTATRADDGLGPLFVARSCVACHPGAGRSRLPPDTGAALRLAGDPVYGAQLQTSAVAGQKAEGRLVLREETLIFRYPDGQKTTLRRIVPSVAEPAFGPLSAAASLRLAPPLFGLGALEQAGARFGWKGDQPDLIRQTAGAFHLDIGMSTPLRPEHWGDCTPTQTDCRAGPHGDSPEFEGLEISSQMLGLIAAYLRDLPPPTRAKPDKKGAELFAAAGCAACHSPTLKLPSGESVAPYSDLALHDMGPALADEVPGVVAAGGQWRTQPLWGTRDAPKDARGRAALLHDGRARNVEEAVLWHGGEAEEAKKRFAALSAAKRRALLRFVESL